MEFFSGASMFRFKINIDILLLHFHIKIKTYYNVELIILHIILCNNLNIFLSVKKTYL